MAFNLHRTSKAQSQLDALESDRARKKRFKAVIKALRLLAENPRHPGLNTHEWHGEKCPHKDKVWEAYAENKTPGAYRIFFCYGPSDEKDVLWILEIIPHP